MINKYNIFTNRSLSLLSGIKMFSAFRAVPFSLAVCIASLFLISLSFSSCRKMELIEEPSGNGVTQGVETALIKGMFVLNEGNMGSNKASLDYFDYGSGIYSTNIFPSINPSVVRELGDVGNDLKIYGGKLYAVINCSNYVEVMDAATAKHITAVSIPNCRSLAFYKNYAYVSSFAGPVLADPSARQGYVAKIDTLTYALKDTLCVGYQPEQMAVVGKYLFVANSGGYMAPNYDTRVSVIDLDRFTLLGNITVAINLSQMEADSYGNVYVSSQGDYGSTSSDIYVIDAASLRVKKSLGIPCSRMTLCGDSLYVLSSNYTRSSSSSNVQGTNASFAASALNSVSYIVYNVKNQTIENESFIKDGSEAEIKKPYGLAVNPESREIFVTDATDYVTPGKIHCYAPSGVKKWSAATGDIPAHIVFAKKALQWSGGSGDDDDKEVAGAQFSKVLEYMPAPGQFINEGFTASTMSVACSWAEKRMKTDKAFVSLGGFGGYIIVGFDHNVTNDGGYNIEIKGNSFSGSSEPGIVYVMQDANGNGVPDDTWYELAGSETAKGTPDRTYSVTYQKPAASDGDILWTDSKGVYGKILHNQYHAQSYYPAWVTASSMTLYGTRLPDNNTQISENSWVNAAYEWGYADNFSLADRLAASDPSGNPYAVSQANYFKISNAIDASGKPVSLSYINFVKIQTGVNCQDGWIGEESTEIVNVRDYNKVKSR